MAETQLEKMLLRCNFARDEFEMLRDFKRKHDQTNVPLMTIKSTDQIEDILGGWMVDPEISMELVSQLIKVHKLLQ
jgi:hypothetical protein